MGARARRSYIGLSNYPARRGQGAARLAELGTPCLVNQPGATPCSNAILSPTPCRPAGSTAWGGHLSPRRGLLSDRYLAGIPGFPRRQCQPFLTVADQITEEKLATVRALHALALQRGQSPSQLALQWVLRDPW